MRKSLLTFGAIAVLIGVFGHGAAAQAPEPPPPPMPAEKQPAPDQPPADPCPRIDIKVPNLPVREGVPVKLSLALGGGDRKVAPMFDWSVSAGVISSGQGTQNIEIDTIGAGADRAIYATVLLGGFAPECVSSANAVIPIAGPAKKVDEFGSLPDEELSGRIANFMNALSPADQAYIIAYAGRTNVRGYAATSLRQIRAQASKSGITNDRLITMDGGYRDGAAYELWYVPIGAEAPRPTPTVSARDIVFPKPPPRTRPN